MSSKIAGVASLLVLVLAVVVPAMATDYTVGDTSGWTSGVDYSTWASGKTFNVGDTLTFQYGFLHSVNEVTKSDYDSCTSTNSIQSYSDQNTKINLDKASSRYFICGTAGHCSNGMKLAVTVAPSSSSSGSSTPATTPSTSSPSTPSATPAAGSTPSQPTSKNTPTTASTNTAVAVNGKSAVMVGVSSLVGVLALVV